MVDFYGRWRSKKIHTWSILHCYTVIYNWRAGFLGNLFLLMFAHGATNKNTKNIQICVLIGFIWIPNSDLFKKNDPY